MSIVSRPHTPLIPLVDQMTYENINQTAQSDFR